MNFLSMRRCIVLLVCCASCGGGDDYSSPFGTSYDATTAPPGDVSGTSDSGQITDNVSDAVTTASLEKPWPSGSWTQPQRLDEREGATPSAHLLQNGDLLIFYSDSHPTQENARPLYFRRLPVGGTLSAPSQLATSGYYTALSPLESGYLLAAANRGTVHLHGSDDGVSWSFQQSLAASDDVMCDPQSRPQLFSDSTRHFLLFEFVHKNAVLGCVSRVHFARFENGAWLEPQQIASQRPAGLYVKSNLVVVITTKVVLRSSDGGVTFTEIKGGDLTNNQLGGTTLAVDDLQTLHVTQTYNYANKNHLALLSSNDAGESWTRQLLLVGTHSIDEPQVVSDGKRLIVVYLKGDGVILGNYAKHQLYAVISNDRGLTWSTPQQLSAAASDRHVQSPTVLVTTTAIHVLYGEAGANLSYEFKGVFLTSFSL